MITLDELKEALPIHLKSAAKQPLLDKINNMSTEPEAAEIIRDNFIGYTRVLADGKFKTEDYLNAVTYVSYKVMGETNQDAYKRTFPQRYAGLVARGATAKDISSYVSAYNKNKLVNSVLEQTLVPTWVLNQDIFQRAINTQAELMLTASSEKVRTDAANSLLTHLKKPETKHELQVNVGMTENSGMTELKEMLTSLAQRQQDLIGQGVTTKEIAHQKLGGSVIDGKAKDVTPASS